MGTSRKTKALAIGGAAAAALVAAAGIANAASSGSAGGATGASGQPTAPASGAAPSGRPAGDPAKAAHGPGETLLTGTTAEQVKAAALAAVPGATVVRVETDSGGATYEAHLKKADGTYVTVKLDASFKVTATQSGFGAGPAGSGGPGGPGGPGDKDGGTPPSGAAG